MKVSIIFAVLLFSFSGFFVLAQNNVACSPGDIDSQNNLYCDFNSQWTSVKDSGETCLNDYECSINSCIDGVCKSLYEDLSSNRNFFDDVWSFFNGLDCNPLYDLGYHCQDSTAFVCGEQGFFIEVGEIAGYCGVSDDNDNDNQDSRDINIVFVSPKNLTYSNRNISLNVFDEENIAKYWRYSLNGGTRETFNKTYNNLINARLGSNILTVYASRLSSFSDQTSESIHFSVVENKQPSCGDNICDVSESSQTCSLDCGSPTLSLCEQGECDSGCPQFCPDEPLPEPKLNPLAVILLILIILLAIVIFFVLMYRKRQKDKIKNPNKNPLEDKNKNTLNKNLKNNNSKNKIVSNKPKPLTKKDDTIITKSRKELDEVLEKLRKMGRR